MKRPHPGQTKAGRPRAPARSAPRASLRQKALRAFPYFTPCKSGEGCLLQARHTPLLTEAGSIHLRVLNFRGFDPLRATVGWQSGMSLLSAIDDAIAETEAHMMTEVIAAPTMACYFDNWRVQSELRVLEPTSLSCSFQPDQSTLSVFL